MLHTLNLEGRQCWVVTPPGDAPQDGWDAVYMVAESDFGGQAEAFAQEALAQADAPFVLAAFASEDWNRDFSPWEAPALFKKAEPFAGQARATLDWLLGTYVPHVEAQFGAGQARTLLGYSLGGLFSLWALYNTDAFANIGSCSGSLWFDGWLDYVKASAPQVEGRVYLSLGDREGKARNQRMAAVEPVTLEMAQLLQSDTHIRDTIFEWNEGGHFDGVQQRLLKAVHWLQAAR